MKIDIDTLKDTFKIGYDDYLPSRTKAALIENPYHNRQFTPEQLNILGVRGQPAETFNVIKLFSRQLLGYYSTVINTVTTTPVQQQDVVLAGVLNDVISYINRTNNFVHEGDSIKLDGFLSGLMVSHIDVVADTEVDGTIKEDEFGRTINKVVKTHIPSSEIVLDPMSTKSDYSDARFIHRFKWMPKEEVTKLFGKQKTAKFEEFENFLNVEEAEFTYRHNVQFQGHFTSFENYLVVHTVIEDEHNNTWSIYWSGDHILDKKKINFKGVKFPYRVVKLQDSDNSEYYGVFEEVYQSQYAINQAVIQIQMMVNSNKVLVQEGAVKSLSAFTEAYNRVNAVIPVLDLKGIQIDNMSGDIQQQYIIIDKASDRI